MKQNKFNWHNFLMLMLVLGLFAFSERSACADIVIGAVGPMSGQYADFGQQISRGAAAAVAKINQTGGINGEKISLLIADDGCQAHKALAVAQELIAKHVRMIIGHYCSFSAMAASPIYAAAGVVMITPSASNPRLTEQSLWNIFRLAPRDDAQGEFVAHAIAQAYPPQKIAIFQDGSAASKARTDRLRRILKASGNAIISDLSYPAGIKDFSTYANKLSGADVIYTSGPAGDIGLFLRQLRDLGVTGALIGGDELASQSFWTNSGEAGEGTRFSFPADPVKMASPEALPVPLKKAGGVSLPAYAAVEAWTDAARNVQDIDGRKIARWLKAGHRSPTILGEISFDSKGDLSEPKFIWLVWSAGKLKEVSKN